MKKEMLLMGGMILVLTVGEFIAVIIPFPKDWPFYWTQFARSGVELLFLIPFFAYMRFMDLVDEYNRGVHSWFVAINEAVRKFGIMYLAFDKPDDVRSSSTQIGYGEFAYPDSKGNIRTVTVSKWLTKYDVPEKYQIKEYPRFKTITRFALVHLLPPDIRFPFGTGRVVWDETETGCTKVCSITVDESMYKYRDPTEKIEYPVFNVVEAQGDKQFREHPERLFEFSLEKKPIDQWTDEEKKFFYSDEQLSKMGLVRKG